MSFFLLHCPCEVHKMSPICSHLSKSCSQVIVIDLHPVTPGTMLILKSFQYTYWLQTLSLNFDAKEHASLGL